MSHGTTCHVLNLRKDGKYLTRWRFLSTGATLNKLLTADDLDGWCDRAASDPSLQIVGWKRRA